MHISECVCLCMRTERDDWSRSRVQIAHTHSGSHSFRAYAAAISDRPSATPFARPKRPNFDACADGRMAAIICARVHRHCQCRGARVQPTMMGLTNASANTTTTATIWAGVGARVCSSGGLLAVCTHHAHARARAHTHATIREIRRCAPSV